MKINIFWFRRDLRLDDNAGLFWALKSKHKVLPIFIFDEAILSELPRNDARVAFIHSQLLFLQKKLNQRQSSLLCLTGNVLKVWEHLTESFEIEQIFTNTDYEPYARKRDADVQTFLKTKNIDFHTFKDHVVFEKKEVLKNDSNPYTIFTPYKNQWLKQYRQIQLPDYFSEKIYNFVEKEFPCPSLEDIGFENTLQTVKPYTLEHLHQYSEVRDFPAIDATSYLSVHLRFGTVSIRQILSKLTPENEIFLNELIWREFFMQILYHFPQVVTQSFKTKYNKILWRNNQNEFQAWCEGKTGYPMVDAGMRQLNATGYMHNRVRMVTASFLCKHLLIDWRWGEAYFAKKLLDFELSANNGNWQWTAGTGCDAAPYFRIFNPYEQQKKFDKHSQYLNKWLPELGTILYPQPIVEHSFARKRALDVYKIGINE
jgi:deoxyribodipyrimidine photo-lyase